MLMHHYMTTVAYDRSHMNFRRMRTRDLDFIQRWLKQMTERHS